jgi:hypothetical protein
MSVLVAPRVNFYRIRSGVSEMSCPHEAEWTPFQTRCFSENVEARGIEPGTSGSVARSSDH